VIDLAKIIAEKRHIENEPILLRDILPKVMRDIRRQRRCRANDVSSYQVRANAGHVDVQGVRRQRRSRVIAGSGAAGRSPSARTRPGRTPAVALERIAGLTPGQRERRK